MALNSGKILMRRGQEVNFDPNKMTPGEWAVSLDNKYVRMCFSPGVCVRMATYDAFEADMVQIQRILSECQTIEEVVTRINEEIKDVVVDVERVEIAASSALQSEENALNSANSAMQSAETATNKAEEALNSANIATEKAAESTLGAETATQKAEEALQSSENVRNMSDVSQSYAIGGTGKREGEDTDNAKYYNQQASDNADRAEAAAERASAVADIGVATTEKAGLVKPDGTTITVDEDGTIHSVGGGGGSSGTMNYDNLENKPSINGNELFGDKTAEDLGLQPSGEYLTAEDLKNVAFSGSYNDLSDIPTIPTKTSELQNDSGFMQFAAMIDSYEGIMENTEENQFVGALGVKEGMESVEERIKAVSTIEEIKDGLPTYSETVQTSKTLPEFINYFDGYYVIGKIEGEQLVLYLSLDGKTWDKTKTFELSGCTGVKILCSCVNKNEMLLGTSCWADNLARIIKITSIDGNYELTTFKIYSDVMDITYGNGLYVAVINDQGTIYASSDGVNFNRAKTITAQSSGMRYVLTSVTYSDYGFVAFGYREYKFSGTTEIAQMYIASADGITWSDYIYREEGYYSATIPTSIVYARNLFFVVCESEEYLLIADAKDVFSNNHTFDTWLQGYDALPYNDAKQKMIYAHSTFVLFGFDEISSKGVACISQNGISEWENIDGISTTDNIIDAVYNDGKFLLLDAGGRIYNIAFDRESKEVNKYVREHLINENEESFYFGFNGKERGFYTDRSRAKFYPFLQNVPQIIEHGEITIATTSDAATYVAMEKHCVYMMPVVDITISTGAVRGYRTYIIYTSENPSDGTGVITKSTLASGGNGQLTITDVKEVERVGVTIKPNNVAYKTRYSLIKLM